MNKMLAAVLLGTLAAPLSIKAEFSGGTPRQQEPNTTQKPPPDSTGGSPAYIRVSSNLVTVPVSVTDANGKPVENLQAGDFRIEEDNKLERIAQMAEPGQTPVDLVLLFDISGSVNARIDFEREAATRFIQDLIRPEDSLSILTVAAHPDTILQFTTHLEQAVDSLRGLTPTRGMTAFFDSILAAARMLRGKATPYSRHVVVSLSDGEDNNSDSSFDEALKALLHSDCIFYAIDPAGPSAHSNRISIQGLETMRSLAAATGGAVFIPGSPSDLGVIFSRISAELRAQYLLCYYSSSERTGGSFRRIVVTVPGRPDLSIHARQGYYAPPG